MPASIAPLRGGMIGRGFSDGTGDDFAADAMPKQRVLRTRSLCVSTLPDAAMSFMPSTPFIDKVYESGAFESLYPIELDFVPTHHA